MNGGAPATGELSALLRLIDDETPAVREQVAARLAETSGDLSETIAELGWRSSERDRAVLSALLHPARAEMLRREWIVPGSLGDDWDSFEHLLRLISDFLHDGVSLRQSLPDALDLLAEEAEEGGAAGSEEELCEFLFGGGRFRGDRESYYDPRNSDLGYALSAGTSNPIGLCLVFILIARRLGLEVSGVPFPGHFLCRFHSEGEPVIVDCFDHGRRHPLSVLLAEHPELGGQQKQALRTTATPDSILQRVLMNLSSAFSGMGREDDARLVTELRSSVG
jgi:hypothetical protein